MSVFSMTVISLKIKSEKQIKKQKKRQIIMEILITNAINIFFISKKNFEVKKKKINKLLI